LNIARGGLTVENDFFHFEREISRYWMIKIAEVISKEDMKKRKKKYMFRKP